MKQTLLIAFVACFSVAASAQWNSDTTVNNPICTASPTTTKTSLVSAPDGTGGMYIAWEDSRTTATTGTDIYLQRVSSNGALMFDPNGVLITNATGTQTNISMVEDGVGGVLLIWQDNRLNARNDIYGQRITSAGAAVWLAGGVPVTDTTGLQTVPALARINGTEAVVFYRSDLGSTSGVDLYASKISLLTGLPVYNKLIANGTGTQTSQSVLPDSSGGAFFVWQDPRVSTSNSDIYAQRINNAGDTLWSNPSNTYNGLLISNAANNQLAPAMTHDGAGGIVITWGDLRTSTLDQNIYAQRVSGAGVTQWNANGKLVTSPGGNQTNPLIMKLPGTNYFIFWSDQRAGTSNRDIYIQKLNAAGDTLFTGVSGKPVVVQTGNQPVSSNTATFVSDSAGGVIIIWDDARYGLSGANALDIRAQRLNNNGDPLWLLDGVPVSTRAGSNQSAPVAVADGMNGAIVAWQDSRTSSNSEIYGSRVFSGGALPIDFLTIGASQNKDGITVLWKASCDNTADHFVIEKSFDGRQFSSIGTTKAITNGARCIADYEILDKTILNGISYYRVQGVDKDGQKTYSPIAKVSVNGRGVGFVSLYPNPAKDVMNVQLGNFLKGKYQMRIVDMMGKIVQTNTLTIQLPLHIQVINISKLNKGAYQINLVGEDGKIIDTKQMMKL